MTSEAIQFIEENTVRILLTKNVSFLFFSFLFLQVTYETRYSFEIFPPSHHDQTEPFFMYFNPTVPHGGHSVDYAFQNFTCRNTPNGTLDEDPIKYFPFPTCQEYRNSVYNRSANVDELGPIYVDDSLGAILEALNATGKLNNTLIIFQQDHGMETKSALYENGIRVAQFAWYPSKIQAGLFDKPVSSIDIAATVLDFAGINVDYPMDGISWKEEITAVSSSTFSEFDNRCLVCI